MAGRFIGSTPYGRFLMASGAQLGAFALLLLEHGGRIFVGEIAPTYDHTRGDSSVYPCPICRFPKLAGMLAVYKATNYVTGEQFADEQVWWVEPEYRKTSLGPRLLAHMEGWARMEGLPMVKMVAPNESDHDTGRFLARRGYTAIETVYQKGL